MYELKYTCNVFVKLLALDKKKQCQNTCIILILTVDMHRNPRAIHGHANTFFLNPLDLQSKQ